MLKNLEHPEWSLFVLNSPKVLEAGFCYIVLNFYELNKMFASYKIFVFCHLTNTPPCADIASSQSLQKYIEEILRNYYGNIWEIYWENIEELLGKYLGNTEEIYWGIILRNTQAFPSILCRYCSRPFIEEIYCMARSALLVCLSWEIPYNIKLINQYWANILRNYGRNIWRI